MEMLFATASLFVATLVASFIYYKRIREAQSEYESSKDLVRDITMSFTRQIRKVSTLIGTIESESAEAKSVASEALRASTEASESMKESSERVLELSTKIEENERNLSMLREELRSLSSRRPVVVPQRTVDAAIPLREDAVLDQLTPTELEVLMLIEEMDEASGPAIRETIGKTREHTARLLKKLFENGFIDRNTSGMPYRYSVRKEIKDIIQQQKEGAPLSV